MERGSDGATHDLELDPLSSSAALKDGAVDGGASEAPRSLKDVLLAGPQMQIVAQKKQESQKTENGDEKAKPDGGDSPESGSLYSDENEIPSGYVEKDIF